MAKETAEEKLLKMLQKSGAPVAATAAKAPVKKKPAISISIRQVNQILFVGIIACVAALVWQLRDGMTLLQQDVDIDVSSPASSGVAQSALPSVNSVSVYIDKINSRNIFKPFEAQVSAKEPAKTGLVSKVSKYKLVGVAWLDLPETASVMIEDTATKQTYFLKQGEQIDGVTVKTIYTDRVVLGDENEETTIKL